MLHDTVIYRAIYLAYFLHFLTGIQESRKHGVTNVGLCLYDLHHFPEGRSVKMETLESSVPMFMIGKLLFLKLS